MTIRPDGVLMSRLMGVTSFDAFRIGDILGPGIIVFNSVQVPMKHVGGVDWVTGPGQGGVSMCLKIRPMKDPSARWWRLPAGSSHPDTIKLVQDRKNHGSWEPIRDMLLTDYRADLLQIIGWQIVP
jgi:hypothetical protein